jgi:hypothetical protein
MRDSHTDLLNRDFAVVAARPLIDICSPLLRKVVDHATWALVRCSNAADVLGGPDEDLAAYNLYRQVIECSDGIEVLVSQSACRPAIPVLRSAFEATLGLEYLLREDYKRRSLAWLYVQAHQGLRQLEQFDPSTPEGQAFWSSLRSRGARTSSAMEAIPQGIAARRALLEAAHLAPIKTECQRLKAERRHRRNPPWYALFGGPANLRELTEHLGRQSDYDALYRYWSRVIHGLYLNPIYRTRKGQPAMRAMRDPDEMRNITHFAVLFQVRATRLFVGHFRPHEDLSRWYMEDVRPLSRRLSEIEIEFEQV